MIWLYLGTAALLLLGTALTFFGGRIERKARRNLCGLSGAFLIGASSLGGLYINHLLSQQQIDAMSLRLEQALIDARSDDERQALERVESEFREWAELFSSEFKIRSLRRQTELLEERLKKETAQRPVIDFYQSVLNTIEEFISAFARQYEINIVVDLPPLPVPLDEDYVDWHGSVVFNEQHQWEIIISNLVFEQSFALFIDVNPKSSRYRENRGSFILWVKQSDTDTQEWSWSGQISGSYFSPMDGVIGEGQNLANEFKEIEDMLREFVEWQLIVAFGE